MKLTHVRAMVACGLLVLAMSACGGNDAKTGSASPPDPKPAVDAGAVAAQQPVETVPVDICLSEPYAHPEQCIPAEPTPTAPQQQDSEARRAARDAQTGAELYWTENRTYVGLTPELVSIAPSVAEGVGASLEILNPSTNGYTLSVASASGTTFSITRVDSGQVRRECSAPQTGDCTADGTW